MDRFQYVKTLIEERDNLKKENANLHILVNKAKKRTKEDVLNFTGKSIYNLEGISLGNYGGGSISHEEIKLPENELVSDEAIKKLHQEIHHLEIERLSLDSNLHDLQNRDFVKYLKGLINEG